jgi:autotransporter-associated beta strand protein
MVEFANSGGTLTVSGVLDRNGDSAAIIRATSNNNTSAINVSGSGLFNVRGQTTIGTAYGSSTNNTLNINLSNSGTFNATSWVNVSPVKGQIVNLNLSGTSVFKATEISLNEGGNTVSDGKACVNVSVADNALFQSTGILHIGRTSENVETNLVQTGGTVKAQRIRLNDVANKQQNVGIYQLNGGVMLISSDGNSRADNNRNIGDSAITVGADSFVYLNGGTIAVNGNNNASNGTASGTGRMIIQDGGVTIDTQVTGDDYGFAANLALEHGGVNAKDGGLVKTGVGTLLLNAANTYTGDTIVNAGTLILGDAEALGAGGDLRLFNGVTVSLSYSGVADLDALWFNDVIVSSLNIGQSYTAAELNNALSTTIFTGVGSLSITQIPEPSTLTLLLIGAGLLTVSAARRRKCER